MMMMMMMMIIICNLTLYLYLDQDQVVQQELTIPCLQREKKNDDTAVRVHVLRTIYYRLMPFQRF